MTSDIKREVIKALAYGKSPDEIAAVMEIPVEEVQNIKNSEVNVKRAELIAKGYIK